MQQRKVLEGYFWYFVNSQLAQKCWYLLETSEPLVNFFVSFNLTNLLSSNLHSKNTSSKHLNFFKTQLKYDSSPRHLISGSNTLILNLGACKDFKTKISHARCFPNYILLATSELLVQETIFLKYKVSFNAQSSSNAASLFTQSMTMLHKCVASSHATF